ncbi:murein DD-endopeptidase MepM [Sodalis sp. CWE]|uniref:murein DD-endopeptidase MepM n=1 Tax=Sodalis sp. CWE TaxID=2803816 RepID=UPI00351DA001
MYKILVFNRLSYFRSFIYGSIIILIISVLLFYFSRMQPIGQTKKIRPCIHLIQDSINIDKLIFKIDGPSNRVVPDNYKAMLKNFLCEHKNGILHKYNISAKHDQTTFFKMHNNTNIVVTHALSIQEKKTVLFRHVEIIKSIKKWSIAALNNLKRLIYGRFAKQNNTVCTNNSFLIDNYRENIVNVRGQWCNSTLNNCRRFDDNFITAAYVAGLTGSDINSIIEALQWQLDLHKLHRNAQFSILILRDMMTKSKLLVGVRLHSSGKDYYAFRANNGNFYNLQAVSLTRNFMRFPTLKRFRASSNFNLYRFNPITRRITPHQGVDFAVPIGTPVLAVGDGEVIVSKRGGAAGNYVSIRHDRQYTTRYMHLKKMFVKPGQKVRRGDRIALSGNTGRSTAPHLHYEMWINQRAVNPLTAILPRTKDLTGLDRVQYLAQVNKMLPHLQLDLNNSTS